MRKIQSVSYKVRNNREYEQIGFSNYSGVGLLATFARKTVAHYKIHSHFLSLVFFPFPVSFLAPAVSSDVISSASIASSLLLSISHCTTASNASVSLPSISCSTCTSFKFPGNFRSPLLIARSRLVLPIPFLPTRPYLLPLTRQMLEFSKRQ